MTFYDKPLSLALIAEIAGWREKMGMKKLNAIWDIAIFVRYGVITLDDLEGFREELIYVYFA